MSPMAGLHDEMSGQETGMSQIYRALKDMLAPSDDSHGDKSWFYRGVAEGDGMQRKYRASDKNFHPAPGTTYIASGTLPNGKKYGLMDQFHANNTNTLTIF